jgi:hypothetical protein
VYIGSDVDEKFIIIALKEVLSENVFCIRVPRVRFQWRALVNTVMNLQVTRDAENLLIADLLLAPWSCVTLTVFPCSDFERRDFHLFVFT